MKNPIGNMLYVPFFIYSKTTMMRKLKMIWVFTILIFGELIVNFNIENRWDNCTLFQLSLVTTV